MLYTEVRRAVTALQSEMHGVREAIEALTPLAPPMTPTPPLTGNGRVPAAHAAPPPEAAEPFTPAAGQDLGIEATTTHDATPQIAATVVIPEQRDSDGPGSSDNPLIPVDELRRAVRDAPHSTGSCGRCGVQPLPDPERPGQQPG